MRISDSSSDVCSSDLVLQQRRIEESRPEIERGQQVLAEVGEAPDAIGLHRQLRVVALERKVEVDDAFHEERREDADAAEVQQVHGAVGTDRVVPEMRVAVDDAVVIEGHVRSEEHKSELQSIMRNSYA